MRYLALILGAVCAGVIGVALLTPRNHGAPPATHDAIVMQRSAPVVSAEADCPNLVPMSELRDVVRDERGNIVAAAFVGHPAPPASAPQSAPIS